MGGIKGLLNQQFAITIAISVLISAFNALTLSPALLRLLLRAHARRQGPTRKVLRLVQSWFGKMTDRLRELEPLSHPPMGNCLLLLVAISVIAVGMGRKPACQLHSGRGSRIRLRPDPACPTLPLCSAPMPPCARWMTCCRIPTGSRVSAEFPVSASYLILRVVQRLLLPPTRSMGRARDRGAFCRRADAQPEPENEAEIPGSDWIRLRPARNSRTRHGGRVYLHAAGSKQRQCCTTLETLEKLTLAARKRPEIASLVSTFRPTVPQLYVEVDQDRVLKQACSSERSTRRCRHSSVGLRKPVQSLRPPMESLSSGGAGISHQR